MLITKADLDTRICDFYNDLVMTNEETFREFIQNSEKEWEMEPQDLDNMNSEELNKYLEFMDYLWTK